MTTYPSTITLVNLAAAGSQVVGQNGTNYLVDAYGRISANLADVVSLLAAGFRYARTATQSINIGSPLPADLVSIKAAATPANGAITIAAQPPQARKLQIRIVIGTSATTQITAGTLTLVGVDQDGNAITETISLVSVASQTLTTTYAYAKLTSGTVASYAADGSGTGNTLGIGVSNAFGVPTQQGGTGAVYGLACVKATKITKVLGTSNTAADDVAATTTVDNTARTITPTTTPAANGLVDYEFTYTYGIAD